MSRMPRRRYRDRSSTGSGGGTYMPFLLLLAAVSAALTFTALYQAVELSLFLGLAHQ